MRDQDSTKPGFGLRLSAALPCEAKPLIRSFDLHPVEGPQPFTIYRDSPGSRWLIVTGVGRQAATMAISYLAGLSRAHRATAWLNVGIAGHATLPLGSGRVAHKISDTLSETSHYPSTTLSSVETEALLTVTRPEKILPPRLLVDMEGSAFYAAASTYSSPELIHCLKIVSDHGMAPDAPLPSKHAVSDLIQANTPLVETIAEQLLELSSELAARHAAPPYFDAILTEYHFTTTQQARLNQLLQKWHTLLPQEKVFDHVWKHAATSSEVLACLETRLGQVELTLPSA